MSISEKKRLSEKKELFLAICLISGEISSETIRRMKADFGDTQIKNNVIQSLRKDGYIKRVNRRIWLSADVKWVGVYENQISGALRI